MIHPVAAQHHDTPTEPVRVYILQGRGEDPVKIGATTRDVADRVSNLQTGHPWPLRVVHEEVFSSASSEREIHHALRDYRLTGEWFEWCPEVAGFVETAQAHGLRAAMQSIGLKPQPEPEESEEERELLSCGHLAKMLGKHIKTIRKWANNGDLPSPIRLPGGARRWRPEDIERWLQGLEEEAS